jgi:GGDEF domain-containing protein
MWIAACQFDGFLGSLPTRMMLSSTIAGIYLFLCASEIWRARDPELVSRWPAIVLLLVHAVMFLGRVPFVDVLPFPGGVQPPSPEWFPIGVFALLFHNFCMSVLLVNMAKERAELHQRRHSLLDPLTGVANCRAFFERGEELQRHATADGNSALSSSISIGSRRSTTPADIRRATVCVDVLRWRRLPAPGDLFGRFGGEEFACSANVSPGSAAHRRAHPHRIRGRPLALERTSRGERERRRRDVTRRRRLPLFASADRALYRAKARGNRVEPARTPLQVVETAGAAAG